MQPPSVTASSEEKSVEMRKSSYSSMNGGCVIAGHAEGLAWRAASGADGSCVTGAVRDVIVSDDKDPSGPRLHMTVGEWASGSGLVFEPAITREIPARLIEARWRAAMDAGIDPRSLSNAWYRVTIPGSDDALYFDRSERDAFRHGVREGEFELVPAAMAGAPVTG
jgi:hypothetical protein